MTDDVIDALNGFVYGQSVPEIWDSARRLMLNKRRASVADDPLLLRGLEQLRDRALDGSPLDRLLAIDLLVRVPASIRKSRRLAQALLREALRIPPPSLALVTEKKELPSTAKPAEIRENVARALEEAEGEWVLSYVFQSLAEEDRSQRCRNVLSQQVAKRTPDIEEWLDSLIKEPAIRELAEKQGLDASATRLRDIAQSLHETIAIQRQRLTLSDRAGHLLSQFSRTLVPLGPRQALPRRLAEAGAAVIRLLDELLAVRLTLMDEPQVYEVLEALKRWWSPAPYPRLLVDALTPIVAKIIAGIAFRARGGQRSDRLVQRLRQALNDEKDAKAKLSDLAKSEHGLSPEIQDWLLGIERIPASSTQSSSRILTAVGEEGFMRALSPAFLLAQEALGNMPEARAMHAEIRLANLITTIGKQYGLEVVGKIGDKVEYIPTAYETVDGHPPLDRHVELVRPIVMRHRSDGTRDVVIKGLVKSI